MKGKYVPICKVGVELDHANGKYKDVYGPVYGTVQSFEVKKAEKKAIYDRGWLLSIPVGVAQSIILVNNVTSRIDKFDCLIERSMDVRDMASDMITDEVLEIEGIDRDRKRALGLIEQHKKIVEKSCRDRALLQAKNDIAKMNAYKMVIESDELSYYLAIGPRFDPRCMRSKIIRDYQIRSVKLLIEIYNLDTARVVCEYLYYGLTEFSEHEVECIKTKKKWNSKWKETCPIEVLVVYQHTWNGLEELLKLDGLLAPDPPEDDIDLDQLVLDVIADQQEIA